MIRFDTDTGVAFVDPHSVTAVSDAGYMRATIHLCGSTLVVIGTAREIGEEINTALKEGTSWFD